MSIHESGQMYLETIYLLSQRKPGVRAIDVGEELGYSKKDAYPHMANIMVVSVHIPPQTRRGIPFRGGSLI